MSVSIDKPAEPTAPGALYQHSRHVALKVVAAQIAVAICVAGATAMVFGGRYGYSMLVGAGVGILPTYYLVRRMFGRSRPRSVETALRSIYVGEGIKVVFTIALFVIAMMTLDVNLVALAVGYLVTVAVTWLATLVVDLGESPEFADNQQNKETAV